MGMDIFIIALLIFIGLVMVILEVFFLPGITIAGISAVLFFVGAVFYAFMQLGEFAGYITIAVSVIVTIIGIIAFIRSRSLDRMALKTTIDSVAPTLVSDQIKVGDEGITLSRLNPMGSVLINNITVEARTREDFIDEDTPVVVEKVDRTTVIVQKKENEKQV
ncbi:MAG: NfeD family protein [Tannerella sp.]|uniref:NfeD family protein n=1 Tax=uncultured Coprobacter sp. TaxID=1720550 RepID=UPI002623B369|nr:NfeD family protein [uncultured Coprobacter sp.]MBS6268044.1 NfeD family protein [Tannerella sp.]